MGSNYGLPGPPWSWQQSLQEMLGEVGIDVHYFISQLRSGASDQQLAADLGISEAAVRNFREHFEQYGIDSVLGQD